LILFHAGMIYHSLAKDAAETYLSRALTTNAHFHVFYAETASGTLQDIAQSGNRELRSSNAH
jgi:hypothetical protein